MPVTTPFLDSERHFHAIWPTYGPRYENSSFSLLSSHVSSLSLLSAPFQLHSMLAAPYSFSSIALSHINSMKMLKHRFVIIKTEETGIMRYLHNPTILLDDKHRAKVSDFGSSKTIEIDQTHLTTLVQGTFGYLDPEYFDSGIFTEKSDVYSFGVVLLELLTSKKPIYRDAIMEQKVLVVEFFLHLQSSNLLDLLDPEVVNEAKEEQILAVANLAKRCLHWSGRLRPTMKEVEMTLEMIIKSPAEMSTDYQQTSPYEGFNEVFMPPYDRD